MISTEAGSGEVEGGFHQRRQHIRKRSNRCGRKQSLIFYLNDLLGTTLATVRGSEVEFKPLTAFGQPLKAGGTAPASRLPAISLDATESIAIFTDDV
ncbi:MAG: hypothetical protein PHC88_12620 [Terrimicrobiaceae bacterium]|nr:hypothetical protein [Terrimicrobiaceae bacterium]